ncbi:AI-2E family transporter [Ensifer sp. LCM 4579]|uniref:AI-2E family transporter n=1 Tax=Ensifer sp. LCM 4579 TaxID=1848292 RepID=UPI0008D9BA80|nr:AI-2E family transporter [Ensifer sp. LCM 4579]OHV85708.1 AI-2E family transporter [Ensifer sp. LCM 4579]
MDTAKDVTAVGARQRDARNEAADVVIPREAPTAPAPGHGGMDLLVACSIVGLFVIACAFAISALAAVLMPIAFAIIVGIVLGRAADGLTRFGLPPLLGGLLLALCFVVGLFFLVNALLVAVTEVASEAPRLAENIIERVLPFFNRFGWLRLALARGASEQALADAAVENAGPLLGTVATSLTPALIQTLVFLAALVLFLLGRIHLRSTVILAVPSREGRLGAIRIMNAIEESLARYFATTSLIYMALGVFTMVIALVGGLPMAPLWGLFAFVSSYIPYLGVTLMTLSLLVGGLMIHDALIVALAPVIAFTVIHLTMENLIVPAILGQRFEMNPFLIFIAIIFWTWMWGAVGAILAMPLALIATTIFEQVRDTSSEPQLPG